MTRETDLSEEDAVSLRDYEIELIAGDNEVFSLGDDNAEDGDDEEEDEDIEDDDDDEDEPEPESGFDEPSSPSDPNDK